MPGCILYMYSEYTYYMFYVDFICYNNNINCEKALQIFNVLLFSRTHMYYSICADCRAYMYTNHYCLYVYTIHEYTQCVYYRMHKYP